jgi:diaminopimelate decarboxylase
VLNQSFTLKVFFSINGFNLLKDSMMIVGKQEIYPPVEFTIKQTESCDQKGHGVVTTCPISAGQIYRLKGKIVNKVAQHTLEISPDRHFLDTKFAGYLMHSCEPNARINMQNLTLEVLRDINIGELLTIDYAHTEKKLFRQFPCSCNAPLCRFWIKGNSESISAEGAAYLETLNQDRSLNDWWQREGLNYEAGRLCFEQHVVQEKIQYYERPVFLYFRKRIESNIKRLETALEGLSCQIFYALKSNRFLPLLTFLKENFSTGIDVCSPGEIFHALSAGFSPQDISYTSSALSPSDLNVLERIPDIRINADSLSAINNIGARQFVNHIGLRLNLSISLGYNEKLCYSGKTASKFGIYLDDLNAAIDLCRKNRLTVQRLHVHSGCGYLNSSISTFRKIVAKLSSICQNFHELREINFGGGLGIPFQEGDSPLNLSDWAAPLHEYFPEERGIQIQVEPGSYIIQDAGLLALQVVEVEVKSRRCFVYLNGGFNLAPEPVFYNLPFYPLPCIKREDESIKQVLVGNINEAHDIWFEGKLPILKVGDWVALINAGAYASSMSSNHCFRGEFYEKLI